MLSTDRILHKALALVFEEDRSAKHNWKERIVVLIQNALLVFKPDVSIIETAEEFKISLRNARVRVSRDLPQRGDYTSGFEVLVDKVRRGFLVHSAREAERWKELISMAISWSNYEQYCSFQQILPASSLLEWVLQGEGKLVLDFSAVNSFATIEFLRGNAFISELVLQGIKGQVPLLTRTLTCFPPTQLRELTLSSSELNDRGLQVTLNCLANNVYLEVLDLSRNALTAKGVALLFRVFPCTPSLATLSLAHNPLKDEGVQTLLPAVLRELELRRLDLSATELSGASVFTVKRVLAIRNLSLLSLKLSDNPIPLKGVISLLREAKRRRSGGLPLSVEISPLPFHPDVLEAMEDPQHFQLVRVLLPSGEMQVKPMPRLPKHRATIEVVSSKVKSALSASQLYVEDLCDLVSELASLEFQFPRSRFKDLAGAVEQKLELAMKAENLYCLEKLLRAQHLMGVRNAEAEALFDQLSLEATEVTEALRYLLTPENYANGDLEEMNTKLDAMLRRARTLGMKGELVATAIALQELRDDYI